MSSMLLVATFVGIGLMFTFAYLSEREPPLRWLVYLALGWLNAAAIVVALPLALMGGMDSDAFFSADVGNLEEVLSAEAAAAVISRLPWLGLISLAVGIAGLLLLLPIVRRLVAQVLPIDAHRTVHALALQVVAHLIGVSAAVALFLPALLLDETVLETSAGSVAGSGLGVLWAQAVGFVILAVLGVGSLVQRDAVQVLDRLGLTRAFNWKWWIAGTVAALSVGILIDWLWVAVDSQSLEEVERLSEALFAPYLGFGLVGALTIGLSAGIGEEILFRGAAQPRLGLIFTSLLFAIVHTQYTVSLALVQIFVVGLILGLTRQRANTTTAIATHATYNFALAAVAIYLPQMSP